MFAAPIPGQITGFVGGFLFGAALGTVYATIGGTIGCSLVFILARRFGRPFVEGFVSTKITDRFDYISDHGGAWVLLLIFVVQIFPDDLICYLSGLTRIPLRQLILVALVGRIPGYLLFSLARRRRRAVESDAGGRYCSGVGGGGRSRLLAAVAYRAFPAADVSAEGRSRQPRLTEKGSRCHSARAGFRPDDPIEGQSDDYPTAQARPA